MHKFLHLHEWPMPDLPFTLPPIRVIFTNPSRIYHMQYGLSKETNELRPARGKLGEGGFGRMRHAYLEDRDKNVISIFLSKLVLL